MSSVSRRRSFSEDGTHRELSADSTQLDSGLKSVPKLDMLT